MTAWQLRRATVDDLDAIMALEQRLFATDAWSRPTMAANTKRKALSMIEAAVKLGTSIAARPAHHNKTSPISGAPVTGSRPVQFGTAVNRKPAMTPLK